MKHTSIKIKIKLLLLFVIMIPTTAVAQEYKYEIGGMAGGSMYMGDLNQTSLMQGWNPSVGVIFRNNLNFRWALKSNLFLGFISGDTKNTDNVFPNDGQVSFKRSFFELGGQMEFNFLPYSDKFSYLNTSKVSPYVFSGLGLTFAPGDDKTFFGINLPLGIGVKYKMRNRLNLGVEFAVHKLFGDSFDVPDSRKYSLDNPYQVNSGLFKNKDWYNTLFVSITWEFGLRDERCTTF